MPVSYFFYLHQLQVTGVGGLLPENFPNYKRVCGSARPAGGSTGYVDVDVGDKIVVPPDGWKVQHDEPDGCCEC